MFVILEKVLVSSEYMDNILIDTDIIIWFLRGDEKTIATSDKLVSERRLFSTPVSVAEVYAGAFADELETIDDLFYNVKVLEIVKDIGQLAGGFMVEFKKSHRLEIADALIVAAAKYYKMKLWTLNKKHFPMLKRSDFFKP